MRKVKPVGTVVRKAGGINTIDAPTNLEYRPRPSRWKTDQHARDEQQLAVIAIIMAVIVVGFAIYINKSGTADRFIDRAGSFISFII